MAALGTSKNILLVEDEPTLQRILGSVLSDVGHHVDAVGTAEQAIERLEESADVDLVLTDKNLPRKSGLHLLSEIRALENAGRRATAVVMVTGYPSRDSVLEALSHNVDGYLVKPFRSLSHAVEQLQGILRRDPRARRAACAVAKRVADALSGAASQSALVGLKVCVLDVEGAVPLLKAAGAEVVSDGAAPDCVVGTVLGEVVAHSKRLGIAAVLVDAGASFNDVVELIHAGGGVVLDADLIGAPPTTATEQP